LLCIPRSFSCSNIANLVPPFERQGTFHGTSAALEYAVCALKVEHIVVMGHQKCGGIRALMERGKEVQARNDFIDNWMEIASAACERTRLDAGQMDLAQQCAYCERESINVSLANLLTFPWIKDAVSRRALQLHGWYYDMEQSAMSTWKLRYQITDYTKLQ
jgi:carbonic anhydrase